MLEAMQSGVQEKSPRHNMQLCVQEKEPQIPVLFNQLEQTHPYSLLTEPDECFVDTPVSYSKGILSATVRAQALVTMTFSITWLRFT